MHLMVFLVGGRKGISKTYQAFFYGAIPAILFMVFIPLAPVYAIFVIYSIFVFYECLKNFQEFTRKQAIFSILMTFLIGTIILISMILFSDTLLTTITSQMKIYAGTMIK